MNMSTTYTTSRGLSSKALVKTKSWHGFLKHQKLFNHFVTTWCRVFLLEGGNVKHSSWESFEICIVRLHFFNVWSFSLKQCKRSFNFWILKLLFLLHGGLFLQRDYHKNIDAMKLMNNAFFVLEKHVRKKCSCWMCISEKKIILY
jgi:hypothetical protein